MVGIGKRDFCPGTGGAFFSGKGMKRSGNFFEA